MSAFSSELSLAGYDRTVVWLHDRGLSFRRIKDLLRTSETHVRQLDYRGRRRFTALDLIPRILLIDRGSLTPPGKELRRFLGVRTEDDTVVMTPKKVRRLQAVEDDIETLASDFWNGVRFENGIHRLYALLPATGRPAHTGWMKLRGRIHELIAETHLHFGKTVSAIYEGLRAYHLYRVAHHESIRQVEQRSLLMRISRMSRLLSQMFILRREEPAAREYLELHVNAQERLGLEPRAEYHHQLAILAFCADTKDSDDQSRSELTIAMDKLRHTVDYGLPRAEHEVKDIGLRHLYQLRPRNWALSLELMTSQIANYPAEDIHIPLNVAATAACGLSMAENSFQQQALDLLQKYQPESLGYLRTESCFRLLNLTPMLPRELRPAWTRFALYENTSEERRRIGQQSTVW